MNNPLQNVALNQYFIRHGRIWLVGSGLALLHLVLTWRLMQQVDQVAINALFWLAILGTLINHGFNVRYDRRAYVFGLLLLGAIVAKSLTVAHPEAWFVRLFPALAVVSLGLLISGFHLKRHWRAGVLLIPLLLPRGLLEQAAESTFGKPLQVLTAQVAAFVLHYIGFDTSQRHTTIIVNHGAVDVLFRCTGMPLLILLSQLALLFFVMFPLHSTQRMRIIILAVLISFLLSSLRVALMALVVTDPIAFAYWHGGNGSQIFSTGAIVLFGWLCQRVLPRV
ncbi:MAG: archaeosortase/exosortase family protein [Leptolyngbya sp. BL-A-14]